MKDPSMSENENSSFSDIPYFLMNASLEVYWKNESAQKWIQSLDTQKEWKDFFFEQDKDILRQKKLKRPKNTRFNISLLEQPSILLSPLNEESDQIMVQILSGFESPISLGITARIREKLQDMEPAIAYLCEKMESENFPKDPFLLESIETISRGILQMEQTVMMLRLLNEIEEKSFHSENIDLIGILREICPAVYILVPHLERQFDWDLPKQETLVEGNETLLSAVVLSLLSNAFEATQPGDSIFLKATIKEGMVQVVIRDTGKGLQPECRDNLFNPIYRKDGRKYAETLHLGLPVSQQIINALGGRLMITSSLEDGTSVQFTLPIQKNIGFPALNQSTEEYLSDRHSILYRFFAKLPIYPYK